MVYSSFCFLIRRRLRPLPGHHIDPLTLPGHFPVGVRIDGNDAIDAVKAEAMAKKTNKWRADYYNFFTDKTWGDAKSYDLTLDSSLLPMEANVELVKTYLRLRGFID